MEVIFDHEHFRRYLRPYHVGNCRGLFFPQPDGRLGLERVYPKLVFGEGTVACGWRGNFTKRIAVPASTSGLWTAVGFIQSHVANLWQTATAFASLSVMELQKISHRQVKPPRTG